MENKMDKKIVIEEYLQGNISYNDFLKSLDKELIDILNKRYSDAIKNNIFSYSTYTHYETFQKLLNHSLSISDVFCKKYSVYDIVYKCFGENNIKYFEKYKKNYEIALDAIPEYLASDEASEYIEREIIDKLPIHLSESKRKKYVKDRCKTLFCLEKNHYPHWVQESEWPIKNGKPLRYIGSKRSGDLVQFIFDEIETKKQVIIEQYY